MPAYNEEGGIERAVGEALAALEALPPADSGPAEEAAGEVLVVDDGSTDRTPEILARLAAADPRLRVVRHAANQGIGGFNRRMLAEARGEWVFFIGADGEWDAREALRFLEAAEHGGFEAVLGYRRRKRYGLWRSLVSFAFNTLTTVLFGIRIRDAGSIRLLRRELYAPLSLYSQSAFLNAERLLVGRRKGARMLQVPVEHRPRLAGTGGGARLGRVVAAFRDLFLTRLRWFRFVRWYG